MTKNDILPGIESFNRESSAHHLKMGRALFVGAVYDESSDPVGNHIALIVGINYGQRGSSQGSVEANSEMIGYRKHVRAIVADQKLPYDDHHVVLWNFFPYLTESEWLEEISNKAHEAEKVFDEGYNDPIERFAVLTTLLKPDVIVFHGVSSAVPLLARVALRESGVGSASFLVHNLARGSVKSYLKKVR